uniref:Ubiquitinyl hydrolase 1 n=1 Tax=Rhodosorus marinus TaxID=101924 RepID=A0A7S3E714_9RHOD|mmetsp:Transcript_10775/g.44894  ORF Transcript_10775/g.44894 Transcript_10775/m.44894 type:complete len:1074 (+) Transcript_10775:1107-4328(+)
MDEGRDGSLFPTADDAKGVPEEHVDESEEELGPASTVPPAEEQKDENSFSFTFEVTEFSTREKKLYSPEHHFGGYRWRLLVFPAGNGGVGDRSEHFSVYLDCPGPVNEADVEDPLNDGQGWSRNASFKLRVLSQKPGGKPCERESKHQFSERDCDWGFQDFALIKLLYDPKECFRVNDTVVLQVSVTLQDAQPQYDSRKTTGFAGLKNQGATCYMNSLLQTLYTIGTFRRGVYQMSLPEDVNSTNITYALQRVFYDLQKGQGVVRTKKLTRSFGWDTVDAFTQHDVQELNRLLTNHLEETLKKEKKENYITKLFEGKQCNYIECVNVPYKSENHQTFLDLQLTVKGCKNIYESFDKFTEVEMLDGENKYKADGYDEPQDARMGYKILALPPVLQLHLIRIEFDPYRGMGVKINDWYEFGNEIDLTKYVEKSDGNDVYVLHSVLVHSGDVNGGHYYAFIRPNPEDGEKWYKFDDEIVTEAKPKQALDDNFGYGGEAMADADNNHPMVTNNNIKKCTSAYWLQYIRKDHVNTILEPFSDEEVPEVLEKRLVHENEEEELRRKDRAEQLLYMSIAIVTESDMRSHQGVDFVAWNKVKKMRVKKVMLLSKLLELLKAEQVLKDLSRLRIWKLRMTENRTYKVGVEPLEWADNIRLSSLIKDYDDLRFTPKTYAAPDTHVRLFLEEVPEEEPLEKEDDEVLLFFKKFVPKPLPHLEFVGKVLVNASKSLTEVAADLFKDEMVSIENLSFHEEVSASEPDVQRLYGTTPLERCNLTSTGGIVIVEAVSSLIREEETERNLNPGAPLNGRPIETVIDYFDYLRMRVKVKFIRRFPLEDDGIVLELLSNDEDELVRKELARGLGERRDPDYIKLYDSASGKSLPSLGDFAFRSMTLKEMLIKADHASLHKGDALDLPSVPESKVMSIFGNQDALKTKSTDRKPVKDYQILYYELTDYPVESTLTSDGYIVEVMWSPDRRLWGANGNQSPIPDELWKIEQFTSMKLDADTKMKTVLDRMHAVLKPPAKLTSLRLLAIEAKKEIRVLSQIALEETYPDVLERVERNRGIGDSHIQVLVEPSTD